MNNTQHLKMNLNTNKRYFKKNKPVTVNNQFQKPKVVNNVLTMDFPVFTPLVSAFPTKVEQIDDGSKAMYKNIVETKCKIHVKDDNKGYITLKENTYPLKDVASISAAPFWEVETEENILDVVVNIQNRLDADHERYKKNYIELYGESEYNRNYTMTDSHLYNELDDDNKPETDMDYDYDYDSE